MCFVGCKLGRGVKGFEFKYNSNPTIRLKIMREKQCNTASENLSNYVISFELKDMIVFHRSTSYKIYSRYIG